MITVGVWLTISTGLVIMVCVLSWRALTGDHLGALAQNRRLTWALIFTWAVLGIFAVMHLIMLVTWWHLAFVR